MREGGEGKERDIATSIGDYGNNVEQNIDERSGKTTKEK